MNKGKKEATKFVATVAETQKGKVAGIARRLTKEGIVVEHVSSLFGIITGHAFMPLSELQAKYNTPDIQFEPDREVGI